jgi:hypothetical protein
VRVTRESCDEADALPALAAELLRSGKPNAHAEWALSLTGSYCTPTAICSAFFPARPALASLTALKVRTDEKALASFAALLFTATSLRRLELHVEHVNRYAHSGEVGRYASYYCYPAVRGFCRFDSFILWLMLSETGLQRLSTLCTNTFQSAKPLCIWAFL